MGYYSEVCGSVRMTEEGYRKMMAVGIHLPSFSEPQTVQYFFEEVSYEDGACTVRSYGKHYDLDRMIALLARFKEEDEPDEVIYQGDSGLDDSGTYFLLPGKWAFVSVRYPAIEDVKESDWTEAARPEAQKERTR